jgi:hypothetical protein
VVLDQHYWRFHLKVWRAAQLRAAPDAAPLVATSRALYFSACGSAPVSSGPLDGSNGAHMVKLIVVLVALVSVGAVIVDPAAGSFVLIASLIALIVWRRRSKSVATRAVL